MVEIVFMIWTRICCVAARYHLGMSDAIAFRQALMRFGTYFAENAAGAQESKARRRDNLPPSLCQP
jgi:hypothetical protein